MRDFLYSEIANHYGLQNIPDNPELAIAAGTQLCTQLLEPLSSKLGHISIRSSYRSKQVNELGNAKGHNCGSNVSNFAGHIWDERDAEGNMGATACIVVNAFIPFYEKTGRWEALAWWAHDRLPYHEMEFFPRYAAFNLTWRESPARRIRSHVPPRLGMLTAPGRDNHDGDHSAEYLPWLSSLTAA